jgi:hypothetical protein
MDKIVQRIIKRSYPKSTTNPAIVAGWTMPPTRRDTRFQVKLGYVDRGINYYVGYENMV